PMVTYPQDAARFTAVFDPSLHDALRICEVVDEHTASSTSDEWDLDALWAELKTLYPVSITIDEVLSEAGSKGSLRVKALKEEVRSEEHTSELQSREKLVCRLLLEKKKER